MRKTKDTCLERIQKSKTFGPVQNPEDYVKNDWWRNIFNSYYLKTDGDVVNDDMITSKEVDFYLKILDAEKDMSLLDICCGQGRHCAEFFRRGFYNVSGLDRSRYLIKRGRKNARAFNLGISLREGDARKLPYTECSFDIVTVLGNSFGYFENINEDLKVLRDILRVIKPGGRVLIDVADGEFLRKNFSPRTWEWINKNYFVCRERSLSADKQRLISREVITHTEKGVLVDQFYAERLYTKKSLTGLLRASGFDKVTLHGVVDTCTDRNQDLGMMERRLIITASAAKEWPPLINIKTKRRTRNVAVVLGDPGKRDILKPSEVFDEDDFYTINELKKNLAELKDYSFMYFDNHDSFVRDLTLCRHQIDYVFNLCDEGFNNNAQHELHIPALCEILGVPYTGSGPQCLAYCYDKSLVRGIAREMNIAVPEAFFIKPEDNIYELYFAFPVLLKPNSGDSSFGITRRSYTTSIEQIVDAVDEIRNVVGVDKPILAEEFLCGSDLSVGIIGNPPEDYLILPVIEEDYSSLPKDLPRICGYEAKWMPSSPYWNIRSVPAGLPDSTVKYIEDSCLKLVERLRCRDYCRFDWRLDKRGNPKLLEVNPNPGWCWDGHLARMAKYAGISYGEMIKKILASAEQRLKI